MWMGGMTDDSSSRVCCGNGYTLHDDVFFMIKTNIRKPKPYSYEQFQFSIYNEMSKKVQIAFS